MKVRGWSWQFLLAPARLPSEHHLFPSPTRHHTIFRGDIRPVSSGASGRSVLDPIAIVSGNRRFSHFTELCRHIRQESRSFHLALDSTLAARFSDQRISCGHRDRVACIDLLRSDTRDAPQHVLVYQVAPHGFISYSSGVAKISSQLRLSASCDAKRRACVACVVSALSSGFVGPWVRVEWCTSMRHVS